MLILLLILTLPITAAVTGEDSSGFVFPGFVKGTYAEEQRLSFSFSPEIKVMINAPSAESFDRERKVYLILYALPNGNSTEWTEGRKIEDAGDDWHYDIQHIAAQTRFLRNQIKDANVVTAYLETEMKSWPAWRRKYSNNAEIIRHLVDSLRFIFRQFDTRVMLNGHSGGGSFIFGFINSAEAIPSYVERIGFIDSDYAYDDALRHGEKITAWLKSPPGKFLCVIAYNDSAALYNGARVVSDTGGTWYRSKLMKTKLSESFRFEDVSTPGFLKYTTLSGRAQFILKENPAREILHTRQVELNGLIHSILSGTPLESNGYIYYGPRAYSGWIEELPDHPSAGQN